MVENKDTAEREVHVQWSDDGRFIRKWSWRPFDGATDTLDADELVASILRTRAPAALQPISEPNGEREAIARLLRTIAVPMHADGWRGQTHVPIELAVGNIEEAHRLLPALSASLPIKGGEDWLPIETAPKDGTWVWSFWPVTTLEDQQTPARWVESSLKDGPYWQDSADHIDWCQPTHWRPLPAPPARSALSERVLS